MSTPKRKGPKPGPRTRSEPKPAPGDLRLVHAFVGSLDAVTGADELADRGALASWLAKWGLLSSDRELTEADVARAAELRAGLRSLMRAHGDEKVRPREVERLEQAAGGLGPRLHFDGDGSLRLAPLARDFEEALGSLVGLVFASQLEGTWIRFKICAAPDCRAVFYDYASNHASKWCSLRCGDRIRARAHRRR